MGTQKPPSGPLRLVVVSAGLGTPSTTGMLADLLTREAERTLGEAGPLDTARIELREHARAVAEALLAGFPADGLGDALRTVETADALIVSTPTFQGSYSGLFKSFFDLVDAQALRNVPVLLAASGGTERHSLVVEHALRPLFSFLGALTVPTGVFAATSDFGSDSAALDRRARRAAGQLAGLLGPGLPDMSDGQLFTPFEELLDGAQD